MTKATIKRYLDGHIGDLILWSFAVLCLIAYTSTVMTDKAAVGALGAFMTKRYAGATTNVDTATNVAVNQPGNETTPDPEIPTAGVKGDE